MYLPQTLPFSFHPSLPADLTGAASQAVLTELSLSSAPMSWDQAEFSYTASDIDLPFLDYLMAPGYPTFDSDTFNMKEDKSPAEEPPQFTGEVIAYVDLSLTPFSSEHSWHHLMGYKKPVGTLFVL
ncbi:hypothetical protein FKM82_013278 [Ascaphus truei]